MAQFKVAVLRVQGINKKTYVAGDIVSEMNFPEGVCKELEKKGFLVALKGKEAKEVEKAAEKDKPKGKEAKEVEKAADEEKETKSETSEG